MIRCTRAGAAKMRAMVRGRAIAATAVLVSSALAMPADAQLRSRVHASGLTAPVAFVQDPVDRETQFVVQQDGHIRVVRAGVVLSSDFLNLAGSIAFGGEQGLLGLAFPPDAASTRRFFVNFTNRDGHTVVARFRRSSDSAVADPASRFDLRWGGSAAPAI